MPGRGGANVGNLESLAIGPRDGNLESFAMGPTAKSLSASMSNGLLARVGGAVVCLTGGGMAGAAGGYAGVEAGNAGNVYDILSGLAIGSCRCVGKVWLCFGGLVDCLKSKPRKSSRVVGSKGGGVDDRGRLMREIGRGTRTSLSMLRPPILLCLSKASTLSRFAVGPPGRMVFRMLVLFVLGNSEELTSVNGERLGSTARAMRPLRGCTRRGCCCGCAEAGIVVGIVYGLNPSEPICTPIFGVDGKLGGVAEALNGGVPKIP